MTGTRDEPAGVAVEQGKWFKNYYKSASLPKILMVPE